MLSGSIAPSTICFQALDNAAVESSSLVSCNLPRRSANWLAVHFLYHCGPILDCRSHRIRLLQYQPRRNKSKTRRLQWSSWVMWKFRLTSEYTLLVSVAEYDDDNDDDDDYTYKCCVRRNVTELTWSGIALRKLRRSKLASSWRYRLHSIYKEASMTER